MGVNRKILRDHLQRAINHLEDANSFIRQAYEMFAQYGDHYGKHKEYLLAIGQTIEFAKQNIEKILEYI